MKNLTILVLSLLSFTLFGQQKKQTQKQEKQSSIFIINGYFTPKGRTKDIWTDCDWCKQCGRLDTYSFNSTNEKRYVISFDQLDSWPGDNLSSRIKVWVKKEGGKYLVTKWEFLPQ